jgi:hypothetical protein
MFVEGKFVKIHNSFLKVLIELFQTIQFIDTAALAAQALLLCEHTNVMCTDLVQLLDKGRESRKKVQKSSN